MGHAGQHLDLRLRIDEQAVTQQITLSHDLVLSLLPEDVAIPEAVCNDEGCEVTDEAEFAEVRASLVLLFAGLNPVRIDDLLVPPVVESVQFVPAAATPAVGEGMQLENSGTAAATDGTPGNSVVPEPPAAAEVESISSLKPDVRLILSFPLKASPRRVSFVWDMYPEAQAMSQLGLAPPGEVVAELDAFDENRLITFTESEPEYVWHRTAAPPAARLAPAVAALERPGVSLSALALVLWVGSLIFWIVGVARLRGGRDRPSESEAGSGPQEGRGRGRRSCAVGASLLLLGVGAEAGGVLSMQLPFGDAELTDSVSEAQAAEIFSTLQENVYRAFDYKSENDVYDVLAQSVDGDLLDRLYREIYESLIMRDQGGAVARVQKVEVLDARLESVGRDRGSEGRAFQVAGRWRVAGVVYHWGHVHSRTQQYKARCTIARRGDAWKLVELSMLEHFRVAEPGEGEP
jgi:hypothetical protein